MAKCRREVLEAKVVTDGVASPALLPVYSPSLLTLITHPQCTQFAQRQGLPRTIRDGNEQFKKPVNKRNRPLKLTNQGAIESHKIR
jgi:hypothetical protein